jgi:hypothetical protein
VISQTREAVIGHGEIKDFMEAMTMGYKVSSPSTLKTVKAGDKVRFTIDTNKNTITKIEKLKTLISRKDICHETCAPKRSCLRPVRCGGLRRLRDAAA